MSEVDLSFSRTNAQISEMEHFKWDTSKQLEARNASSTNQEETLEESLNTRQFQILLQVTN